MKEIGRHLAFSAKPQAKPVIYKCENYNTNGMLERKVNILWKLINPSQIFTLLVFKAIVVFVKIEVTLE